MIRKEAKNRINLWKHGATILLTLFFFFSSFPVSSAEQKKDDSLKKLLEDVVGDTVEEAVFDNLQKGAVTYCSLYNLGIDFTNTFFDHGWSLLDPIIELTVLFRNGSWRELLWALNDTREKYLKDLTKFETLRCQLSTYIFGLEKKSNLDLKVLEFPDQSLEIERVKRWKIRLESHIQELKAKKTILDLERRHMLSEAPKLGSFDPEKGDIQIFPVLKTDKIFYWLHQDAIVANWEQFYRNGKNFLEISFEDLKAFLKNIPETCFSVVNVGHELLLTAAYSLSIDREKYQDPSGNSYDSFKDFVEHNRSQLETSYIKHFCEKTTPQKAPEKEPTTAEQQYEALLLSAEKILDILDQRINQLRDSIYLLEEKNLKPNFTPEDQKKLDEFRAMKGRFLGLSEFYLLILNSVGSSSSTSLDKITQHLSKLIEAILGLKTDKKGNISSRLSMAERFEKSKERQLQKICSRIETMYRKSGRNTEDLPILGTANGTTYCRARLECEGVNLINLFGGSEGRKKLAECSGFLFNKAELGPSQVTEETNKKVGEDIGFLLEQEAYSDLIEARNLGLTKTRKTYQELYKTQNGTTLQLENMLSDVALDLENIAVNKIYEPDKASKKNSKTHSSVLRKIYDELWHFAEEQEGMCLAPETP